MKSIDIAPAIEADMSLLRAIRQGHDLVEAKFQRALRSISASWSLLHDDLGRPLVRLDLTNSRESAHAVCAREFLEDPRRVFTLFLSVTGDIWREESHRLLEEMQAESPAEVEPSEGALIVAGPTPTERIHQLNLFVETMNVRVD